MLNPFGQQKNGQSPPRPEQKNSKIGLLLAGALGFAGAALVALTTPFVLPALRKHCLPYVPATEQQLRNLTKAFKRHAKAGESFIDIGSGDGRICRLASQLAIFSRVHGVELNYPLVLYSRFASLGHSRGKELKFFHRDLWKFPLGRYDAICIFGVESMMDPLQEYLMSQRAAADQVIYACRFQFKNMLQVDELGKGIDTVWVYRLPKR